MISEQLLFSFSNTNTNASPKLNHIRPYENSLDDEYLMLKDEGLVLPQVNERRNSSAKQKNRKVTDLTIFSDYVDESPLPSKKFLSIPHHQNKPLNRSLNFDWEDDLKINMKSFSIDNDFSEDTKISSYCPSSISFPSIDKPSKNMVLISNSPYSARDYDWNEDDSKKYLWNESPKICESSLQEPYESKLSANNNYSCCTGGLGYDDIHNSSLEDKNENTRRKNSFLSNKRLGNPINKVIKVIKENQIDPNIYKNELVNLVKSEREVKEEASHKKNIFASRKESHLSALRKSSKKNCCSCKQSHCLKLYCECFKNGSYCVDCTCPNCLNRTKFEELRQESINHLKEKNKIAFKSVVITAKDNKEKHIKGCKCKHSNCKKNYCECYQNGIGCSDGCKCENCQNGKN